LCVSSTIAFYLFKHALASFIPVGNLLHQHCEYWFG
jgi:hypothetical protein